MLKGSVNHDQPSFSLVYVLVFFFKYHIQMGYILSSILYALCEVLSTILGVGKYENAKNSPSRSSLTNCLSRYCHGNTAYVRRVKSVAHRPALAVKAVLFIILSLHMNLSHVYAVCACLHTNTHVIIISVHVKLLTNVIQ